MTARPRSAHAATWPSTKWDGACFGVAVLVAYGLKRHYAAANPDQLSWILRPTAGVASALTHSSFTMEQGVGYVSTGARTAIVPACAGVNYLIIAFATLVFSFVGFFSGRGAKCVWSSASLIVAYVATCVVNGIRIAAAVAMHAADAGAAWGTGAERHVTLGVVVYLGSLWVLCGVVRAALDKCTTRHAKVAS